MNNFEETVIHNHTKHSVWGKYAFLFLKNWIFSILQGCIQLIKSGVCCLNHQDESLTYLVKRISRWEVRYSRGVKVCSQTIMLGT